MTAGQHSRFPLRGRVPLRRDARPRRRQRRGSGYGGPPRARRQRGRNRPARGRRS